MHPHPIFFSYPSSVFFLNVLTTFSSIDFFFSPSKRPHHFSPSAFSSPLPNVLTTFLLRSFIFSSSKRPHHFFLFLFCPFCMCKNVLTLFSFTLLQSFLSFLSKRPHHFLSSILLQSFFVCQNVLTTLTFLPLFFSLYFVCVKTSSPILAIHLRVGIFIFFVFFLYFRICCF